MMDQWIGIFLVALGSGIAGFYSGVLVTHFYCRESAVEFGYVILDRLASDEDESSTQLFQKIADIRAARTANKTSEPKPADLSSRCSRAGRTGASLPSDQAANETERVPATD